MPPVRWSFERFVPVAPERVWAWMTDFREDDHARPAFKRGAGVRQGQGSPARREVLSREGNVVRLRDAWGGRTHELTVTLDPAARALAIDNPWGYRSRWWVEENPGGARLRVEGEFAPGGVMGLLAPLYRKRMLLEAERDFRGHVADLVQELNPEGVPVGGGF